MHCATQARKHHPFSQDSQARYSRKQLQAERKVIVDFDGHVPNSSQLFSFGGFSLCTIRPPFLPSVGSIHSS
jgi:hypothetical protein